MYVVHPFSAASWATKDHSFVSNSGVNQVAGVLYMGTFGQYDKTPQAASQFICGFENVIRLFSNHGFHFLFCIPPTSICVPLRGVSKPQFENNWCRWTGIENSKYIKTHSPTHMFKLEVFPQNLLLLCIYQVHISLFYCLLFWPGRFKYSGFSIFTSQLHILYWHLNLNLTWNMFPSISPSL